jgi:tetratricopeptide (TPR) repeat protein
MALAGEPSLADAALSVDTLAGLAQLLRHLRRRQARLGGHPELTYREIAAKTGWSPAIVGGYLTGTTLPPTGRFDELIRLLGASPTEQGRLATARDRIAEGRRLDAATRPAGPAAPSDPTVPRELPAAVAGFTGRAEELDRLDALLAGHVAHPTMTVAAVLGPPGIGKTALAVHWAHRRADRFPDGQLYANLRGFDPGGPPASPAEVVRGFLDALGQPPDRIPAGLPAQVGLFRSMVADRRLLVVLDNAGDAEQVRALLPGGPRCFVVVTSRDQLMGLVAAEGAHPVALDLLTAAEARDLLTERIGERVGSDPDAVDEIVTRSARLPLALALVAARAAAHPTFPLAALAAELRSTRGGLAAFGGDDPATDVRTVFSSSYRDLSPGAARLFRLLGVHPGPDIGIPAAASLAGVPEPEARRLLAELARANLVGELGPGRFAFHDLLRAYAAELARTEGDEDDRRNGWPRALDHYLHTAYAAALLLNPHRDPIAARPPGVGVTPQALADQADALAWFGGEHAVLLAAVDQAVATGQDRQAWQIAWCLTNYLTRLGHWEDLAVTQTAALAAARRLGDGAGRAQAHRHLGRACIRLDRPDEGRAQLEAALDAFGALDDPANQAHTELDLGFLADRRGDHADALAHSERALELFRTADHLAGQANALNAIGWEHAQEGDHERALLRCEEALALHERIGDRHAQAGTLDSLAFVHMRLGHHERAVVRYHQALELYQEAGDRYYQTEILRHLADAHDAAGDGDAARDAWRQAADILTEIGQHDDADLLRARLA